MERVRLGIAGIGNIAVLDVPGYLDHPRCDVVALCDPNVDKARERAEEWGVETVHGSLEDLLADDRVDAVELLTPTFMHADHVVAAAAAGKHVSVQKPIANTVSDGRRMLAATRDAGVTFRVNENCCHFAPLQRARQLVRDGAIGKPTVIRIKTVVGRSESDFQANLDPDGYVWRFDERSPGGHLFDDVVHKYAMALWLLDEHVRSVQAVVRKGPLFFEAPTAALWEYERDDLLGLMEVSYAPWMLVRGHHYGADEFFEIQGTHGFIWVTRMSGEMLDLPPLVLYRPDGTTTTYADLETRYELSHQRSSADFIESLLEGRQADLSPEMAIETLQLAFAVYEASNERRPVDPSTIDESVSPPWWPKSQEELLEDVVELADALRVDERLEALDD
jgi:predicted dehydrogenase